MSISSLKMPSLSKIDKEAAKKTVLSKLGEWAIFMPILAAGLYYLFIEDMIKETAHTVAVSVVDSTLVKERKQLKIMMNFITLQDPEAFAKAAKLEEDK